MATARTPRRTGHPARVFAAASAAFTVTWAALGSLSDWGAYWASWVGFGFIIPELYGVFVNPAFTLSRRTWWLEHLNFGHPLDFAQWSAIHWTVAVVVWLLFAWLSLHIPFGWLRLPSRYRQRVTLPPCTFPHGWPLPSLLSLSLLPPAARPRRRRSPWRPGSPAAAPMRAQPVRACTSSRPPPASSRTALSSRWPRSPHRLTNGPGSPRGVCPVPAASRGTRGQR